MVYLSLKEIKDFSMRGKTRHEMGLKKWVLRWASILFTFLLQYLPVTANQVSFGAVFAVLGAAYMFSLGTSFALYFGVFFLYLGEVLDYVDGTLARCKNEKTKVQGYFIGFTYHEAAVSFLFLGLGAGLYQLTSNLLFLLLGVICFAGHLLNVYFLNLKGFLIAKYSDHFKDKKDKAEVFVTPKMRKYLFLFAFPVTYSKEIILIFGIIDRLGLLIFFYAIFLPVRTIIFFAYTYKMFGDFQKKIDL